MNDPTPNIPATTGKIGLELKVPEKGTAPATTGKIGLALRLPEKGIALKLPQKGIALTLPNIPPTEPEPGTALSVPEMGLPLKLPETPVESLAQQPLREGAKQFEPMDDFEIYCHEPSPGRF